MKTKRLFSFLLASVLLLTLLTSLISCVQSGGGSRGNNIDFGKKYMKSDDNYYVFNRDGTGYRVYRYVYDTSISPEYNYISSGRVDFVWREAADGAIYLFETNATYDEDHTEGKDLSFAQGGLCFGDDFFVYSTSNQFGSTTHRFIKENSSLEKLTEDEK